MINSITKISKLFFKIVGFFLILIAGALSWLLLWPSSNADQKCTSFANPVRISVGDTEFHIPANMQPHFENEPNKPKAPIPSYSSNNKMQSFGYCQKKEEAPYKVDNFSISGDSIIYETNDFLKHIQFQISNSSEDLIPSCSKSIDLKKLNWKQYDENPLFEEAIEDSSTKIYFSDKLSLFGSNVIIRCLNLENTGRLCKYAYLPITSKSYFSYLQFFDSDIKPSDWLKANHEIEVFVQSLIKDSKSKIYSKCKE